MAGDGASGGDGPKEGEDEACWFDRTWVLVLYAFFGFSGAFLSTRDPWWRLLGVVLAVLISVELVRRLLRWPGWRNRG